MESVGQVIYRESALKKNLSGSEGQRIEQGKKLSEDVPSGLSLTPQNTQKHNQSDRIFIAIF